MEPIYVASNGDDNLGTGSIGAPYRTLRKASTAAKPGTTIYVRGGTYPRDIITGSGDVEQPILYTAYSNEVPRFHSTDSGEAALAVYASHCRIEGLQVVSSIHCGVIVWNASYVEIIRCRIEKTHRCGIYIGGTGNKTNYTTIILRENLITNTCIVRSKEFEDSSSPGAVVVTKTDGAILEQNLIHNNYGEGIIFSNSVNGHLTQNTIYDNFRCGIYLDNCAHTRLERNYIYSTGKTKFFQEELPMSGVIIGNEERDLFINSDGLTIQNNIITRYTHGILYDGQGKSSGMHNCYIAHNTFYRGYREAIRIVESKIPSTGNEVVNNIFDHNKAYKPIDGVDVGSQPGFKFHHNGWSHPPVFASGPNDVIGDSRLLLLNRHYDFVDPAAQFKLKENSPMRDAGKYIPAIKTDFWGTPRTAPFCIGAHELNIDATHYSAIMDTLHYAYPLHM